MGGEGGHDIPVVRDGNTVKGRDGSRDLVGGEEAHDSDLRKAAVVELSDKTLLLGLR